MCPTSFIIMKDKHSVHCVMEKSITDFLDIFHTNLIQCVDCLTNIEMSCGMLLRRGLARHTLQ